MPVMVPRWKIVSRRSCAIRSPERFAARASMTRAEACSACARASQWRRFVTITSSAVSVATMSCSEAVRESMPVEFLADMWIMGVSAVMAWEESAAMMSVSVMTGVRSDLFAAMMSEVEVSWARASAMCGRGRVLNGKVVSMTRMMMRARERAA